MSNHFTGLSLGPPLGDQRLDLCDLYAFQSPADPARTAIILNANPSADGFHPDAIYRLNIDTDGDLPDGHRLHLCVLAGEGRQADRQCLPGQGRRVALAGARRDQDRLRCRGLVRRQPNIVKSGNYSFFWGTRSDAFFFDFDGIKNLFDTRGKRNFTEPHLTPGKSPWTGVDSNTEANVFSTAVELPTSELGGKTVRIWGRCSLRRDGKLLHVDRAGHPSVSQLLQHRRHQGGIQRQRAGQRPRPLAGACSSI